MRNLLVLGIVAIVMAIGMPAMAAAEEPTAFYAFSKVAEQDVPALIELSDQQLATVEGSHRWGNGHRNSYGLLFRLLRFSQNVAVVNQNNFLIQINIAIGDNIVQINDATQTNVANIFQGIRG